MRISFVVIIILLAIFFCVIGVPCLVAQQPPQRIISLAPSITEELYLLGLGDRVVGVTIYCEYPPEVKKKEKIGTLLSPNIEKIVTLNPDLILATMDGNRPEVLSRLSSLGLRVFTFEPAKNFQDISRDFLLLGKLVSKENEAEKLLSKVRREIEEIKEKVKGLPKVKVFWEVGAKPLVSVAKGTFADEIISLSGGINIAHGAGSRYPRYSLEEVLRQNPEVIILVTMGDVTEQEIKIWKEFKDLKAVKDNRIYVVDADLVCRATPARFQEAVREIASLLHPEILGRK